MLQHTFDLWPLTQTQFSRPFPPPGLLRNAMETFLGGGVDRGQSTDSGPEGPGVSPRPTWTCCMTLGRRPPFSEPQLPQSLKQMHRQHHRPWRRHRPLPRWRHLVFDARLALPSPSEQRSPGVCARAVGWSAVPFEYPSSGSGANGTRGRDDWESQQCGREYGFTKITFGSNYGSNGSEPQSAARRPQRWSGR